jgi:hypothetical protein
MFILPSCCRSAAMLCCTVIITETILPRKLRLCGAGSVIFACWLFVVATVFRTHIDAAAGYFLFNVAGLDAKLLPTYTWVLEFCPLRRSSSLAQLHIGLAAIRGAPSTLPFQPFRVSLAFSATETSWELFPLDTDVAKTLSNETLRQNCMEPVIFRF